MKKLRYWIISKLFTEDEKYLLAMACEDKCNKLSTIIINEKWVDVYNANSDIHTLLNIKSSIFSTNLYR